MDFLLQHSWIVGVFSIVCATLVVNLVIRALFRKIYPKMRESGSIWDDTALYAIGKPIFLFIWLVGLTYAGEYASFHLEGNALTELIDPIRKAGFIATLLWSGLRFITQVQKRYIETRKKADPTTITAIGQIVRAALLITTGLIALQSFGIPVTGILAFGSASTVIVGIAAREMIANFFGGLMLFLDRPFKVGDWVRSPDKQIEGTVEHIGWRLTRIRTFDKRPLYVPNNVFSTIALENPSRMLNRRIYTTIGLRYEDAPKMKVVLAEIEAMLRNHPEIDTDQTLMVNLIEFGPSSLNFMIYTFTKTTEWIKFQAIQQDVFLKTIDIITKHGAECAFPTTTVHVPEEISWKRPMLPTGKEDIPSSSASSAPSST